MVNTGDHQTARKEKISLEDTEYIQGQRKRRKVYNA